jgi:hypothetical protein
MTVLEKGIAIGEVVVYELDTRLTRKTKVIQTGQDLNIGDVCEPGTTSTEKRQVTTAVNEVQTVSIAGTSTTGTIKFGILQPDGSLAWTDLATWHTTPATFQANIQAVLDNLLGSNAIVAGVASSSATPVFTMTFSGTGYAALPQPQMHVDISALDAASTVTIAETTKGHTAGGLADSVCLENRAAVDEVQTLVESGTPTGGTYTLSFMGLAGAVVTTGALNHSDSAATVSTAIDAATGVTAGIVCTGGAPSTDGTFTFTYSGTGFAGRPWRLVIMTSSMTGGTPATGVQVIARSTTGKQNEGVFLTAGPAIVDKDQLDYNSATESVVDAALLALGIDAQDEPTYTVQST